MNKRVEKHISWKERIQRNNKLISRLSSKDLSAVARICAEHLLARVRHSACHVIPKSVLLEKKIIIIIVCRHTMA